MPSPKSNAHAVTTNEFEESFFKTAKERAQVAPTSVMTINLDIPLTVANVISIFPRLRALRSAIVDATQHFNLHQFDKIETYAEALSYAHREYLAASEPTESLPALGARAVALREQLTADATALAKRHLVDGKKLSELKGGNGYLNLASDVGVLVSMLRERWKEIEHKSAIQFAELEEADQLSVRIPRAYAQRIEEPDRVATVADQRARAYTLLVNAYDQARRVVTFLRWDHDDAEKVAPSLWSGRGRRAKAVEPIAAPVATPPVVVAPVAHAVTVEPGLPGGSPFHH